MTTTCLLPRRASLPLVVSKPPKPINCWTATSSICDKEKNRTCKPIHPLRTRRRALDAAQHQPLRPLRGKWARAQTRARAWTQVWRRARHHRSGHVGYPPEGCGHVSPVAASEGSRGRRPCPALPVRLGEKKKQGRREHWESGATRKAQPHKGLGPAPGCLRRVSTSS